MNLLTNLKETMPMTAMRTFLCALVLFLVQAGPAYAQRELTQTSLNANLAASDAAMTVTSSTGFVVGQLVLIDYEVVRITNLNGTAGTSTLIAIQRGVDGTRAAAHDTGKSIWITQQNNDFKQVDPDWSADCQRGVGQAAILPWVNSRAGVLWDCGLAAADPSAAGLRWTATSPLPITYSSIPTSSP